MDLYEPEIVAVSITYHDLYDKLQVPYFRLVFYLEAEMYQLYSSPDTIFYHYNNY